MQPGNWTRDYLEQIQRAVKTCLQPGISGSLGKHPNHWFALPPNFKIQVAENLFTPSVFPDLSRPWEYTSILSIQPLQIFPDPATVVFSSYTVWPYKETSFPGRFQKLKQFKKTFQVHSPLLKIFYIAELRSLFAISYPMRGHGIIVIFLLPFKIAKKIPFFIFKGEWDFDENFSFLHFTCSLDFKGGFFHVWALQWSSWPFGILGTKSGRT